MGSDDLVLVTGASGYIAAHIIQQLLEQGYKVRGTVRSLTNEEKVAPLRKLGGDKNENLELVEADLVNAECWPDVINGCKFVLHTASPFPLSNPKTEDEVIKPALDGTLNVLRACAGKNISRVVVTSSVVSMNWGTYRKSTTGSDVFTEEDWMTPEASANLYQKSKTLAERAAWDYVKDLPEEEKFELAVVNPSMVFGPPLTATLNTSVGMIKQMLNREMPMLPRICFGAVDVRDVAQAHIAAMTTPGAAGNRHIVSNGTFWMSDIAEMLDKEFGPLGYKIARSNAPYFLLWIYGRFNKDTRDILPSIGAHVQYDNSRLVNVLKVEPRSPQDAILDTCRALIEQGHVAKTDKYKAANGEDEKEVEKPAENTENAEKSEENAEPDVDEKPETRKDESSDDDEKDEAPVKEAQEEEKISEETEDTSKEQKEE